MKVCIDPGHGGRDSGARGSKSLEKDINLAVALKVRDFLSPVEVVMTRTEDKDLCSDVFSEGADLRARAKIANDNKADIYVSIHCNSSGDKASHGTETYSFPGSAKGSQLAKSIHARVVGALGLTDRGLKTANFAVLRETAMPAALVELGFINNPIEETVLLNQQVQERAAKAIADGILSYLGPVEVKTNLLGFPVVTAEQAISLARKRNPSLPVWAPDLIRFTYMLCSLLYIRADLVVGLMMHETGFWKYGGDVPADSFNFGGLGANGGVPGLKFPTWMAGGIAVVQHIWAYAEKEPWPDWLPNLDPRFALVNRGSAPYVEDLGGKWAYPGYDKSKYLSFDAAYAAKNTYGHHILSVVEEMKKEAV